MKKLIILILIIVMSFGFSACSSGDDVSGDGNTITFPVSDNEKTEFNAAIFEIKPFDLHIELPAGWTTREHEMSGEYNYFVAWSKVDVFDSENRCVGIIGYNIYEPYEGAEELPQAIYGQVALGNNYHFDVRDSYTVVKNTATGTTAVADVYYSANISNGEEKNNKGILSYNRDLLVYIIMEFNADMIKDEQVNGIAESILISRNERVD